MEHREVRTLSEMVAFEDGYAAAIQDLLHQLESSKLRLLSLQLETEPYTTQRRMLMACTKLLEIYERHFKLKNPCRPTIAIR